MDKSTILIAIFNSYVKLQKGIRSPNTPSLISGILSWTLLKWQWVCAVALLDSSKTHIDRRMWLFKPPKWVAEQRKNEQHNWEIHLLRWVPGEVLNESKRRFLHGWVQPVWRSQQWFWCKIEVSATTMRMVWFRCILETQDEQKLENCMSDIQLEHGPYLDVSWNWVCFLLHEWTGLISWIFPFWQTSSTVGEHFQQRKPGYVSEFIHEMLWGKDLQRLAWM